MKYTFACKRVPLNDSIKEYAQKKISKLERYFREEDTTAFVTFSVEKDHLLSLIHIWQLTGAGRRGRRSASPACAGSRSFLIRPASTGAGKPSGSSI